MTSTLTGVAYQLGEHMSDISEDVYCAGWMNGTEWILWRALQDWRAGRRACWAPGDEFPDDITEHMPRLDGLQREAGGWVWWLDGMQFVPEERWVRLVAAREQMPWWRRYESDVNHELDQAVTR